MFYDNIYLNNYKPQFHTFWARTQIEMSLAAVSEIYMVNTISILMRRFIAPIKRDQIEYIPFHSYAYIVYKHARH